MGLAWSEVTLTFWIYASIWLAAVLAPLIHAWIKRTPMALGIGASLILAWLVQSILTWHIDIDLMRALGALLPAWALESSEMHRYITAAWLHASTIHVLGNALVIILFGVPLEQRLGRGRFLTIYLIGVLGGNIGWTLANWGSTTPCLGASGAAFGLLGCYLACWPRDEIEFPLILIRRWPVAWIALFKFGLEVIQYPTATSNVAHLAHITGFIACYVLAKPIAKGGLVPIGTVDRGPSSKGGQDAQHQATISRMGDLTTDPWSGELTGPALRTLQRLREEGDELETRQAWLEQLAEQAQCPVCKGDLDALEVGGITVLKCSLDSQHLEWP
ncbi:MAG: rhomboid family intramembrane serine protease [Candidatus Thermoplasmatota archaeon]|nr:rhomboid family intramembrane serine protease [Candidatus Thermoplasmatota archaeon]